MLASCEGGVVDLGDVHSSEANSGAGCNGVGLVDALNWHAVDLVRARDQKESRGKLLEEDNSSAPESARQKDQDRTWLDALSELGGSSLLSSHLSLLIVCGIPRKSFDH